MLIVVPREIQEGADAPGARRRKILQRRRIAKGDRKVVFS